jgi:hypothetical protein
MGVLSDGCPINNARLNHIYAEHVPLAMLAARLNYALAGRAPLPCSPSALAEF